MDKKCLSNGSCSVWYLWTIVVRPVRELVTTKPDEPVPEHHGVLVVVRLDLFQGADDKWSTKTVSVLALLKL